MMNTLFAAALTAVMMVNVSGQDVMNIWPNLAPGETTKKTGEPLPPKGTAIPPVIRLKNVTQPTLTAYPAPKGKSTGAAVVILPGGGYNYVVPNLEGSEAAKHLNEVGISAFVLNYRTKIKGGKNPWLKPLQDSQRAVRYVRTHWEKLGIDPEKVGILAFSAGGQVGAMQMGDIGVKYDQVDGVDLQNARPDFAMLIYPWNCWDKKKDQLISQIKLSATAPPAFIVHTDDDASTSLGAVGIYSQLKKAKVSGELHIYQNGGHGYGVRARKNSVISSWPERAKSWLKIRGLGK